MSYNSLKAFVKNFEKDEKYKISLYDTDGFLMFSNCPEIECKDDNIDKYLNDILTNDCFYFNENTIYCSIKFKNEIFCILKASTDSGDLSFFSTIIKSSLESRLEIETQEIQKRKKSSFDELLFQKLISYNEDEIEETFNLAKLCSFSLNEKRAILIIEARNLDLSLNNISFFSNYDKSDFICLLDKHTICCFKAITDDIFKNVNLYKQTINNYIKSIEEYYNVKVSAFVSNAVMDFSNIHVGYNQCEWLVKMHYNHKDNNIYYFLNESNNYLIKSIPFNELEKTFEYITQLIIENNFDLSETIKIADSLVLNNFNLSETSKHLFMHKNTLAYKINKLKECFGINDTQSFKCQSIIQFWVHYIKMKEGL